MATEATVLFTGITYKTHPDNKDDKLARAIMGARKGDTVTLEDSEFERLSKLGAVTKSGSKAAAQATEPERPEKEAPEPVSPASSAEPAKTKPAEKTTGKRAGRRSRAKKTS